MGTSLLEKLGLDPRQVTINMRLASHRGGETPLYQMSDIQEVPADRSSLMKLAGSGGMYQPGRILQAASSRIHGYQGSILFSEIPDGRAMFPNHYAKSLSGAILG